MLKIKYILIMMMFYILTLLSFAVCYASSPDMVNENREATSVNDPAIAQGKYERKVTLKISLSEQGTIEDVTIINSSGVKMLDDAAMYQVKKWHFSPAHDESGKPVASRVILPVRFQMEDDSLASLDSTAIKNIQQKLNELGFDCGEPTGILDSKTEQAIRDFQRSKGLNPNGILWRKTREALGI